MDWVSIDRAVVIVGGMEVTYVGRVGPGRERLLPEPEGSGASKSYQVRWGIVFLRCRPLGSQSLTENFVGTTESKSFSHRGVGAAEIDTDCYEREQAS